MGDQTRMSMVEGSLVDFFVWWDGHGPWEDHQRCPSSLLPPPTPRLPPTPWLSTCLHPWRYYRGPWEKDSEPGQPSVNVRCPPRAVPSHTPTTARAAALPIQGRGRKKDFEKATLPGIYIRRRRRGERTPADPAPLTVSRDPLL